MKNMMSIMIWDDFLSVNAYNALHFFRHDDVR